MQPASRPINAAASSQAAGQITIALDAMGGDHAPAETIRGAALAVRSLGIRVLLVGQVATIEAELARQGLQATRSRTTSAPTSNDVGLREASADIVSQLEIVSAEDTIEMHEHPAAAVRAKRNSPVAVGSRLVKEGRASGFVSAGSTGATMAGALLTLGRNPGIDRPALATLFPTVDGRCLLLDVGANVDCRPGYLAQFAVMGSLYAEKVMGIATPRVGLLNIGEEETKGSAAAQEAYQLIKALGLNFVGNVEGKDVPVGAADVVVADGFVGNVALKMAEGMGTLLLESLRREVKHSPLTMLGALFLKPALKAILRQVDYEEYGGAPLLGLAGVAIVAHGRSRARAIESALRVAKQSAEADLVHLIEEGVRRVGPASAG